MTASDGVSPTLTVRLHVSGLLSQSVTSADLQSRFTSFGEVVSIARWPPSLNGVGEPQNFAYVTLRSSADKIKRCMNLLSGTTWKGGKIRVAEAKKDWRGQWGDDDGGEGAGTAIQQLPHADDKKADTGNDDVGDASGRKKKRKRQRTSREDVRTSHGDVITEADVKAGKVWGWRITPAGHLLRPMQMRPAHPMLPVLNKTTATRADPRKSKTPPNRARNQIIDPARYGAVHLSEVMLGGDDEDEAVRSGEIWVCEEVDGGEGDKVRWVRKRGQEILGAEEVKISGVTKAKPDRDVRGDSGDAETKQTAASAAAAAITQPPARKAQSQEPAPVTSDDPVRTQPASRSTIQSGTSPAIKAPSLGSFTLQPYDPREDEEFSDGYAEDDEEPAATAKKLAKSAMKAEEAQRRERQLNLLRDMFGEDALNQADTSRDVGCGVDNDGAESDEGELDEHAKKSLVVDSRSTDGTGPDGEKAGANAPVESPADSTESSADSDSEDDGESSSSEEEGSGGAWWAKPLASSKKEQKIKEHEAKQQEQKKAAVFRAAEQERRSLFDDQDEDDRGNDRVKGAAADDQQASLFDDDDDEGGDDADTGSAPVAAAASDSETAAPAPVGASVAASEPDKSSPTPSPAPAPAPAEDSSEPATATIAEGQQHIDAALVSPDLATTVSKSSGGAASDSSPDSSSDSDEDDDSNSDSDSSSNSSSESESESESESDSSSDASSEAEKDDTMMAEEQSVKTSAANAAGTPADVEMNDGAADAPSLPPATPAAAPRSRGALLRAALSAHQKSREESASSGQRGFLPVARFEPGAQEGGAKDDDAVMTSVADDVAKAAPAVTSPNTSASTAAAPSEVQMSSLKDMFKPQEAPTLSTSSGIFGDSWLGDEELELEDEVAEGQEDVAMPPPRLMESSPAAAATATQQQRQGAAAPTFFFFPTTAANGKNAEASALVGLQRATPAFAPDSPADIAQKWEHRKSTLTQDYKRRHREAVKKRKRGVVVAGGAGTGGGKEVHLQRVQRRQQQQEQQHPRDGYQSERANPSAAGGANAIAVGNGSTPRWGNRQ